MTKFAICFYGHIRTWEKTKSSFIEKVLDAVYPVIPDIFIHTYDESNVNSNFFYTSEQIYDMMIFTPKNGDKIYPKSIIIQDNRKTQHENYIESQPLFICGDEFGTPKTLSAVKKVHLSYQLMKQYELENQIKYDVIMCSRFDMELKNPLNLDSITNENTLYIYYSGSPDPCDEVVVGLPKAMDVYASRYNELFKVPYEHTWMGACPSNDNHLLLKYVILKCGFIGDWGWTNFNSSSKVY